MIAAPRRLRRSRTPRETEVLETLAAFGLTGGGIGSDSNIDGCGFGLCMVSGYWQSVPEPGSAILLLSALLGFGMLRRPYRM